MTTTRKRVRGLGGALAVAIVACAASRASELAVNAYCPLPIGSARVMGMGGAFTGIGAGAEALICNPAAVMRPDGFALGNATIDYMLAYNTQGNKDQSDFGNVGDRADSTETVTVGGFGVISRFDPVDWRPFGLGVYLSTESYLFSDTADGQAEFNLVAPRLAYGRVWLEDTLFTSFALDISTPTMTYTRPKSAEIIEVDYRGVGGVPFELGALWVPKDFPLQFGARLKGGRYAKAKEVIEAVDPFPAEVVYPGEWALGAAMRIGEPAPEGQWEWWDSAIIDFDIRGVFGVAGTTGFESFRSDDPQEIIDGPLVQPALGAEIELRSRTAWLWLGTYYEPERYEGIGGRTHLTAGFRVRLGEVYEIPVYFAVANDSAERYNVWSTSISTSAGKF